jgi:hypothetical protein
MANETTEDQPEFDRITKSVAQTRAQLFDTLDAIEDKLNVPKQIGIAASRVKRGVEQRPVPYLAAFAGGALAIGGIVVTVIRRR